MPTARTVVFDLGEVLVSSTDVLPALAAELDVTEDALDAAYWPHRTPYDLGGSSTEYWEGVVGALGLASDPALLGRLEELDADKWSTLPPASAQLLDGLAAADVRMGVLSNAPAPLAAAVRAAPWSSVFDHLVFSAEVALVKPDPAIYRRVDAGLGTAPHEVLFFDDRPVNVEAARRHGWDAHIWVDVPHAVAALSSSA